MAPSAFIYRSFMNQGESKMTEVQQVKCYPQVSEKDFEKKGIFTVQLHVIHVMFIIGFLLNEQISILTHDMPCKVCPTLQGHRL